MIHLTSKKIFYLAQISYFLITKVVNRKIFGKVSKGMFFKMFSLNIGNNLRFSYEYETHDFSHVNEILTE